MHPSESISADFALPEEKVPSQPSFTRSSAANIPVNMKACEEMGLDRDTYSVTIPLGATINMDGAAITITMTMATAFTLGIHVDIL